MATLYGAKGGSSNSNLYTINSVSGVESSVGAIGFAVTGLAFDPTDGQLYGATSNQSPSHPRALIRINKVTGAGTLVGDFGLSLGIPVADIAFTSAGTLYGTVFDTVAPAAPQLVTINKASGAITPHGYTWSGPTSAGLTIDGDDLAYEPIGSYNLLAVDLPAAAAVTDLGMMSTSLGASVAAAAVGAADGLIWLIGLNSGTAQLWTVDSDLTATLVANLANNMDALAWDGPLGTFLPAPVAPPLSSGVAFSADPVMTATPTWSSLDAYSVTGWTIDRGRSYELETTSTGRAALSIIDRNGAFDPTSSPLIDVLNHAKIAPINPESGATTTLFRGFVSRVQWEPYVNERFANVTVDMIDGRGLAAAAEMVPDGSFGDSVLAGNIVFAEDLATDAPRTRINGVLDQWGWPSALREVFSGNIPLQKTVYAPRSSVLSVITDTADAEEPSASNVFVSRTGLFTFHGRYARYNPGDVSYHIATWNLGDLASAGATVVPISPPVVLSRDDADLYTSAIATPQNINDGDISGQYVVDSGATAAYGIRTWSAENLATYGSGGTFTNALAETKKFAQNRIDNYAYPLTRVGQLTIRPQPVESVYGTKLWQLISEVDISDRVRLYTSHVGGGGFNGDYFFVEGVHYDAKPMRSGMHEITLTLDVSPAGHYDIPY